MDNSLDFYDYLSENEQALKTHEEGSPDALKGKWNKIISTYELKKERISGLAEPQFIRKRNLQTPRYDTFPQMLDEIEIENEVETPMFKTGTLSRNLKSLERLSLPSDEKNKENRAIVNLKPKFTRITNINEEKPSEISRNSTISDGKKPLNSSDERIFSEIDLNKASYVLSPDSNCIESLNSISSKCDNPSLKPNNMAEDNEIFLSDHKYSFTHRCNSKSNSDSGSIEILSKRGKNSTDLDAFQFKNEKKQCFNSNSHYIEAFPKDQLPLQMNLKKEDDKLQRKKELDEKDKNKAIYIEQNTSNDVTNPDISTHSNTRNPETEKFTNSEKVMKNEEEKKNENLTVSEDENVQNLKHSNYCENSKWGGCCLELSSSINDESGSFFLKDGLITIENTYEDQDVQDVLSPEKNLTCQDNKTNVTHITEVSEDQEQSPMRDVGNDKFEFERIKQHLKTLRDQNQAFIKKTISVQDNSSPLLQESLEFPSILNPTSNQNSGSSDKIVSKTDYHHSVESFETFGNSELNKNFQQIKDKISDNTESIQSVQSLPVPILQQDRIHSLQSQDLIHIINQNNMDFDSPLNSIDHGSKHQTTNIDPNQLPQLNRYIERGSALNTNISGLSTIHGSCDLTQNTEDNLGNAFKMIQISDSNSNLQIQPSLQKMIYPNQNMQSISSIENSALSANSIETGMDRFKQLPYSRSLGEKFDENSISLSISKSKECVLNSLVTDLSAGDITDNIEDVKSKLARVEDSINNWLDVDGNTLGRFELPCITSTETSASNVSLPQTYANLHSRTQHTQIMIRNGELNNSRNQNMPLGERRRKDESCDTNYEKYEYAKEKQLVNILAKLEEKTNELEQRLIQNNQEKQDACREILEANKKFRDMESYYQNKIEEMQIKMSDDKSKFYLIMEDKVEEVKKLARVSQKHKIMKTAAKLNQMLVQKDEQIFEQAERMKQLELSLHEYRSIVESDEDKYCEICKTILSFTN